MSWVQCQQCGQSESVTINHKQYCADCGVRMVANAANKTSVADNAPITNKEHLLDLSRMRAARAHRPATEVHGVRRSLGHESPHVITSPLATDHVKPAKKRRLFKRHTKKHLHPVSQSAPASSHVAKVAESADKPKKRHSHQKAYTYFKDRPRFTAGITASITVIALAGYITYLNYPNITLRVAASRAGFAAQLPRKTPAGYHLENQVVYGPGQISVRFSSNKDTGFVTITQKKTNWDSDTLLSNYLDERADQYATFQKNGLIIYIFDGSNATWINQGVWYTIEGNNHLNPEQVIEMAASI